jgi:hypothetical protein
MGRYAFFNTGLEYKFAFGIQSSQDIQLFGQEDLEAAEPTQRWTAADAPEILRILGEWEEFWGFDPVNVEEFPATLEGTHMLRNYLVWRNSYSDIMYYRYLLTALIFHQLQYEPNLEAHYEL